MRYRNKLFIIIILFIIKVNGDEAGQTLLHTFQNYLGLDRTQNALAARGFSCAVSSFG